MSIIAVFIIIFSVVFDQLSKYWATEVLKNGESIKIIGNFLRFTYAENRGAAFSILQNQRVFFLIITIIMLIILGIVYFTNRNLSKLSRLSMAMIAGGAIGNFIDRYRMGSVSYTHLDVYKRQGL